jgi:branched-subunit amino acid transport protein AzlD
MQEKSKIPKINYIKSRISHNFSVFVQKIKNNKELISLGGMVLDITLLGVLSALSYYSFVTSSIIVKILGFGSLLWLIESRILPMITRNIREIKRIE